MGNLLLLEETPCTYHCRPHARIIGDPMIVSLQTPMEVSLETPALILVGDPRFSMEIPDFRWRPQIFVGMKVGLQ